MTAGRFDLIIEQGATYRLALTFTTDTGEVDEDDQPIYGPQDFAGAEMALQIRPEPGGSVLAEVSTLDGGIEFDDAGHVSVEFTADQTAALTRGRYDLIATYASGDVRRLLEGGVIVRDRITEGSA